MNRMIGTGSAFVLACVLSLGCGGESGPELGPVSGTVTYNGQPVAGANLIFLSEKGPQATATTDEQGKFTAKTKGSDGVTVGAFKVTVTKVEASGSEMSPEDMMKMGEAKKSSETKAKALLPEKYSKVATTDLSFTIEAAGNADLKIELKD